VQTRLTALNPGLNPAQLERKIKAYFDDLAALERFLGQPLESLVSVKDRQLYERAARQLYNNPRFVDYLQGKDLRLKDWSTIMDDLLPLLSHPKWNRIGQAPAARTPTATLA
jgi:hypothetical protein